MYTDNMMKRVQEIRSMEPADIQSMSGTFSMDSRGDGLTKIAAWITLSVLEAGLSEQYHSVTKGR